ncbi:MAG: penicillin-binding transpeptidase domain-containing protein [Candidatus Amulumruptor caecigallinarius]|nr:penicillin-binding transpeptidase domain-containing protein [Candidatus Amulumruptor caecigallinarius]MCM1396472.1 penicillin-binding transpeptidase domain-containing protein [Candidatus Amulumruptor caecigallinarius]MCM1453471.1 penicillin-binding transpeptidase domain-containing protein [bacterium]
MKRKRAILIRYAFVIGLILLFSANLMSHVLDTSIMSADKWNEKALEILSKQYTIKPERGNILAADGSVLATNLKYYTLRIDYATEQFADDSLRKYVGPLSEMLARDFPPRTAKEWRESLLKPLKKKREYRTRSFRLLSNLSYADMQRVKDYPFFKLGKRRTGLHHEVISRRTNPYGEMARRSVGGVGETTECSDIHGISGLEKALDTLLFGTPGIAEKRALTHGIVNWAYQEAVPGYDIQTTIDINMQDIVENELNSVLQHTEADWGVAVLMEVATGDIKAISNLERNPKGSNYIEAMNRAVQGYEPGSVVKTLSMLIALEDGAVTDLDEVIPTGRFSYMGRPINDSHPTTSMKVSEVLEQSSNIAMTRIIARHFQKNPGEFYSRVKSLGFLEPMHTGIAGERVPRFDSVPSNAGGCLVLSRQCFGYATEIPPLYTLALYNAIANDGQFVRPRLVQRLINQNLGVDSTLQVSYIRDRICSRDNAAILRDLLKRVVWGDHGTARSLRNDLVAIAGKTGTSYVIENGAYNTSKKRLTFCGYFPADNPRYSCVVLTCAPKANWFGAASTSGQVVRNIAVKLYSRGMLGDNSDYRTDTPPADPPRLAASTPKERRSSLTDGLALASTRSLRAPSAETRRGHVPDVRGMDLRTAIVTLESAGYNVRHSGTGLVASTVPAASTPAPSGSRVTINLR